MTKARIFPNRSCKFTLQSPGLEKQPVGFIHQQSLGKNSQHNAPHRLTTSTWSPQTTPVTACRIAGNGRLWVAWSRAWNHWEKRWLFMAFKYVLCHLEVKHFLDVNLLDGTKFGWGKKQFQYSIWGMTYTYKLDILSLALTHHRFAQHIRIHRQKLKRTTKNQRI